MHFDWPVGGVISGVRSIPFRLFYGASINGGDDGFIKRLFKKFFAVIAATLVATMVASLFRLFMLISPNTQDNVFWFRYWWPAWSFTPPGWGTLLWIMNFFEILFILPGVTSMPRRESSLVLIWSLSFFALIGATLIGYEMYPAVSRIMGGGRPESGVTFLFGKDGQAVADRLHLQSNHYQDGHAPLEVEGDLIFQTSDFFVLRILYCSPDKRRTELDAIVDKKLINAYFPAVTANVMQSTSEFNCDAFFRDYK